MSKEEIKKAVEEVFKDFKGIEEVADGVYMLPDGSMTGLKGLEQFDKAMKEEVRKYFNDEWNMEDVHDQGREENKGEIEGSEEDSEKN